MELGAIKTAATFAYVDEHVNDEDADLNVTKIEVNEGSATNAVKVTAGSNTATVDISPYYDATTDIAFDSDRFDGGATWTAAGGWVGDGESGT